MTSANLLSRLRSVCDKEPFIVFPDNFYIYVLIDPNTQEIRYIGKCKNPSNRLSSHIAGLYNNTHKENWIRHLLSQNCKPIMLVIWSANDEKTIIQNEIDFISSAKQLGLKLTNGTNGGVGSSGRFVSEETRERIRKTQLGKKLSDETKKKIGLKSKGNKYSLGFKHTEETKKKNSDSHKGLKRSQEARQRLSLSKQGDKNPFYGEKLSDDHKKKIQIHSIGSANANSKINENIVAYIRKMQRLGLKRKEIYSTFKADSISLSILDNVLYHKTWRLVG